MQGPGAQPRCEIWGVKPNMYKKNIFVHAKGGVFDGGRGIPPRKVPPRKVPRGKFNPWTIPPM